MKNSTMMRIPKETLKEIRKLKITKTESDGQAISRIIRENKLLLTRGGKK